MNFDKNTVFAIVLIGLILILSPYYLRWISPPQPVEDAPFEEITGRLLQQTTPPVSTIPQTSVPPAVTYDSQEDADIDLSMLTHEWSVGDERIVNIETPLYMAQISSKAGGSITSWKLKNYLGPDELPARLISDIDAANMAIKFTDARNNIVDLGNFHWNTSASTLDSYILGEGEELTLTFTTTGRNGRTIYKTITFNGGTYDLKLIIDTNGLEGKTINNRFSVAFSTPLLSTEKYPRDEMGYASAFAYLGGELEELDASEGEVQVEPYIGTTDWVAMRTKYFIAAIVPMSGKGTRAELTSYAYKRGDVVFKDYGIAIESPLRGVSGGQQEYLVYLGPLSYSIVKSYDVHLEKTMNFGWSFIRPISKLVLWLFTFMHKSIPNYGIVLIIFSVLVKIVVYPLTHKSYVSMKKMQDIQPLMTEIKEKYKDDQQTQQKKMMALYKEHGVNPLGGCLPTLLQFPLLISLFTVFRSTIELRGAHFVWWIQDLSSQDTIFTLPFSLPIYGANLNVLPLIMGATFFLQQKTSGATANPQQKMMGYFMPVFMVLLFNTFPSGLNLYYSLFNVFSIIQTKYLTDLHTKKPAVAK